MTILLSSVLTGFSESCTCIVITKADAYFSKNWITKRYFKINTCKRLLDLFNIKFTVKLEFVYLPCFTQLDVKNNQAISLFNQLSVPFMFKPPSPGSDLFMKPYAQNGPPGQQKGPSAAEVSQE